VSGVDFARVAGPDEFVSVGAALLDVSPQTVYSQLAQGRMTVDSQRAQRHMQ
jgi:hypothetical protein